MFERNIPLRRLVKRDRDRHFITPLIVRQAWEERSSQKNSSPVHVFRFAGFLGSCEQSSPLEASPLISDPIHEIVALLVVKHVNNHTTIFQPSVNDPVSEQLLILALCQGLLFFLVVNF